MEASQPQPQQPGEQRRLSANEGVALGLWAGPPVFVFEVAVASLPVCVLTVNSFCAELHVTLQRRHLGDRAGPAEAPVGPPGLHAAHGALHRQDHGAGQELRPPDHRQTDLHAVSACFLWGSSTRGFMVLLLCEVFRERVEQETNVICFTRNWKTRCVLCISDIRNWFVLNAVPL